MDVPSGWGANLARSALPNLISGQEQMCSASVSQHAPVVTGSERHRRSPSSSPQQRQSGNSPQLSHVLRVSKSPDDVRKGAFSKVPRLQAAIASLDEDDPERSSLQQALKRAQQQTVLPPVDHRIADCVQLAVEVQRLREGELAVAEQRLVDLQQEAARSRKGRGCSFHSRSNARGDRPANSSAGSSSRVGFGDSEVAHRGGQIQGKSTCPGFGRSSPKCA